jgi:hypothetical protein
MEPSGLEGCAFSWVCWNKPVRFEYAKMTTLPRCPDCRAPLSLSDSTHCPECGTVLGNADSAADSTAVDKIIKTVKEQIISSDKHADAQLSDEGSGDAKDVAGLLSGSDFQDILGETSSDEESSLIEGTQASPEISGEERSSPFSTVLGSFKSSRSHSEADPALDDGSESISAADAFDPAMVDGDSSAAEKAYRDSRSGHRDQPEQAPPDVHVHAPKPRTWWSFTRQTLWLLLILLMCVVFFRIFGPERKEPSIEDFFRPGNPDVEFLDAINFLEKYYERERKKQALNPSLQSDEDFLGSMQPLQPIDWKDDEPSEQAPDNSTPRVPAAASSVFSDPMP